MNSIYKIIIITHCLLSIFHTVSSKVYPMLLQKSKYLYQIYPKCSNYLIQFPSLCTNLYL